MIHTGSISPRRLTGVAAIARRSLRQIVRRPIYWFGILGFPLFMMLFMTTILAEGLPVKVPAGVIDHDGTAMSRELSQKLSTMQMVDVVRDCESFTSARDAMLRGEIFGYFLIPENFQADLLAGRSPEITFYTNGVYFVPATMLFKAFKATAIYEKAGVAMKVAADVGASSLDLAPIVVPVNISARPIGNPWMSYAIYLCVSFIPAALQLMILLVTVFSLGEEIKRNTSVGLMQMARSSIVRALFGKLLPQTLIWWAVALFMQSWLYGWNHYPMHCPWWHMALSELMFVLASQGFALTIFGALPNLRMGLSVAALLGVLTFSLAAFSFPVESMYPSLGIMSWLLPSRYNFLIHIDQALNGRELFYSRVWYAAYIVFMIVPLALLPRIKRAFMRPVYAP